jgi:hypothetical protein
MKYTTLTSLPTPPLQGEGSKITPPSLIGKGAGGLGLFFVFAIMNYTTLTSPPTPPLVGEGSKITPPSLIGKGAGGLGLFFVFAMRFSATGIYKENLQ